VVVDDVGELDKAVIADLDVEVPNQMLLDEAVVDASEILRESTNEDNSAKLIDKGLLLSVKDVIDEANVLVDAPTDLPKVKRLTDPILVEEGKEESEADAKDEAQPVEGAAEAQAAPVAGGRQEGGVFKAAGYTAITFEAGPGEDPWKFLPPPAEGATLPPLVGLDPTKFVAYVSPDTKIVEIHDLVKSASSGPESPVGRITNTYLAHYPCTLAGMTDYTVWKRVNGRLQRQVRHFPKLPTRREDETIHNITEYIQLECLLVLKFKETVQDLVYPQEKRKALFEILDGLVEVDGAFVINDLHEGNIAVMPDGHAVTFDYDRTCTSEEFKADVNTILANIATYEDLPQYKHIVDLDGDANREEKIEKLVKISDILAVLTAVEAVTGAGVARATPAFEACRKALWKSETKEQRHAAINALDAALPVSGGGRRTFRRKGLPQLL
jgi:hypothetical protein